MPSAQTQQALTNGAKSSQVNVSATPNPKLRDLVTALATVLDKVGTEDLDSLVEENESLRMQLKDEEAARRVRTGESHKEARIHEETTKALEELQKKVQSLETQMQQERTTSIKQFKELKAAEKLAQENATKTENACKLQQMRLEKQQAHIKQLEAKKDEIIKRATEAEKKNTELWGSLEQMKKHEVQLAALQSFGVPLMDAGGSQERFTGLLTELFIFARRTFQELVFQHEIDFTSDTTQEDWVSFKRNEVVVSLEIPLPSSNSLLAKQMRFAAALKVLGRVLCDDVFQPVYSSKNNDWIMTRLRVLSDKNSSKEAHARSILLNLGPEEQRAIGTQRASRACSEAMKIFSLIVAEDSKTELKEFLSTVFTNALRIWTELQTVKEHVVPDFEYGTPNEWKALLLPGSSRHKRDNSQQKVVASSSGKAPQKSKFAERTPAASGDDEIYEIWPAFTAEDTLLAYGHYVDEQYLDEAKKEEETTQKHARKLARNAKGNGSISKRRDSVSFLALEGS